MKGYPSELNSKEDYEYVRHNFKKEEWLPDFQALLDSYRDWFFVKDLKTKDEGITDDTHKIVESQDTENPDVIKYAQYELRENPMAKIFRIGYTVSEVEAIINS